MHSTLRYARKTLRASGIALVLIISAGILLLATAKPLEYRTVEIVKGPHKVTVTSALGALPPLLFAWEDDTVTWCRTETGSFSVEFKESPFKDGRTKFTEKDCDTNPPVVKVTTPNNADLYKYTLRVDGKKIDPHVIIVGGGPIE
jgi:hypothetical protein